MARSPELDLSVVVNAPPSRVLRAFFDADALHAWWQAVHSVTTPRALGAFAIEWAPTDFRDEVLGRLGGVFRGTIVHFDAGTGFFVADAYWLAPDGDPIGPMALEVAVKGVPAPAGGSEPATEVRIRQNGFEEGARWRRYYEVIGVGWERALHSLRMLIEK